MGSQLKIIPRQAVDYIVGCLDKSHVVGSIFLDFSYAKHLTL